MLFEVIDVNQIWLLKLMCLEAIITVNKMKTKLGKIVGKKNSL